MRAAALAAMDAKAKPPGSLGLLEEWAVRICELQGTLTPRVTGSCLILFAADHGITREVPGVSAYPRQVTPAMFRAIARGQAASSALCAANGIDLEIVDVGIDADVTDQPGSNDPPPPRAHVFHAKVVMGSHPFTSGAAMMEEECREAMAAGAAAVSRACERALSRARQGGTQGPAQDESASGGNGGDNEQACRGLAIAIGELGIGNTTAASALLCALTGAPPEATVGRGTGVDDEGLVAKRAAVTDALRANADLVASGSALGALRAVGGLELAAMAGAFLEAARRRLPAVVDGFISGAAALAALRLEPEAVGRCLFGSHRSAEAGAALVLRELGLKAPLCMELRLGEGTGAALALPLLRSAAAIAADMASLDDVMKG